jgi:hypothetical protein
MEYSKVYLHVSRVRFNKCDVFVPAYDTQATFTIPTGSFPREYMDKLHPGFFVRVNVTIEPPDHLEVTKWLGL